MSFPFDFSKILSRQKELESKLSEIGWSDSPTFMELTKEFHKINSLINLKNQYDSKVSRISENEEFLADSLEDPEMQKLIEDDNNKLLHEKEILDKKIKQLLLPVEENDGRPVIAEIRAGTGGDEASLFAGELFRMYQRYAESIKLQVEILSMSVNGKGGIKEIVFSIKGETAWRQFKYESGIHRVQRVPVTEASGRIHTSAVTVAILAEPEEVEINIDPKDLRIDTFRSSGPGGQSVNTMDSAIRITHLPTNLVVSCQDEKSQHKNKQKAMRILNARLLALKQEEEEKKRASNRKTQIGSGDRSEKIRTYNFPQNRVTDHRINLTLYNLSEIIEGDLNDLTLGLAEAEFKRFVENA